MQRLLLNEKTRSKRAAWSWTKRNKARAEHIQAVLNELKDWWPVTDRQIFYRIISSNRAKDPCWVWRGRQVDIYDAIGRALKWMRIDEMIPWSAITDEHRIVTDKKGFTDFENFLDEEMSYFLSGYNRCLAQGQEFYVEVWIEKAALLRIVTPVADQFCRRVVVCRGYNSITFQTNFFDRATSALNRGEAPVVLYFGDWDPSGVNMPYTALQTFEDELGLVGVKYYRGGILPEHFDEIPADPVPIKPTDSRSKRFIKQYGQTAYELDAIHPVRLQELVRDSLKQFTNPSAFNQNKEQEKEDLERVRHLRRDVRGYIENWLASNWTDQRQ